MKALLMHPDRDFDPKKPPPVQHLNLTQDLALDVLLGAMAGDDELVLNVSRAVLLSSLDNDTETILHRQQILRDCLAHPDVARQLYALAQETLETRRRGWFGVFGTYPPAILHGGLETMRMFTEMLRRLRRIADQYGAQLQSAGMSRLLSMLQREFSDDYFARIERHLEDLKFPRGVLIGAALGDGNQGVDYVLRPPPAKGNPLEAWLQRVLHPALTFRIGNRDEAGARALGALRDRGINLVANAVAQSSDHILSFFENLRSELAFYVGCLNLADRLLAQATPICFGEPAATGARILHFQELADATLALSMGRGVVGNTVDADGKSLVVITGANQGGKSSFLRAVGLAQLMMQAGMFVAAESFAAEVCSGVFTHYRREEDATMTKGKLDEELSRMSDIIDALTPDAVVLFNESFAATNEREGAEIARQIVSALMERRIKVLFVTHQYELAHGLEGGHANDALFLRAERRPDGTRTFRLVEGSPQLTSYGEDLYREVFAVDGAEVASVR